MQRDIDTKVVSKAAMDDKRYTGNDGKMKNVKKKRTNKIQADEQHNQKWLYQG